MRARLLAAVLLAMSLCAWQVSASDRSVPGFPTTPVNAAVADSGGVIFEIEFVGLRRIPAETLRAHISSREGQPLDPVQVEEDVRALDRLGWFDSITAEVRTIPVLLADAEASVGSRERVGELFSLPVASGFRAYGLRLVFLLEERPFLARVEFRGSRVLSDERIGHLLEEKRIALRPAAPVGRSELWRARRVIEGELAELGHPQAQVRVRLEQVPVAAVRALFEIEDGPEVRVARVAFVGNQAFSERTLRRQMKRVAPQAHLANLRGKKVYTPERLAEDLARLESFYRDRGYPEARVGKPAAAVSEDRERRWLPWPHRRAAPRFHISITVQEGRLYRLAAVTVESEGGGRPTDQSLDDGKASAALQSLKPDEPFSQREVERAAETLTRLSAARPAGRRRGGCCRHRDPQVPAARHVEVAPQFDRDAGTVRVTFRVREVPPYIVHRLEFAGQRRFNDRYYRRRILLKEGEPFDTAKLEMGLAQLARTGFIRPVKKEDIRVHLDETRRTADLSIHVEEIGRQRFSLVGGHGAFGSTVGVVYNVFDFFGAEELLTSHIEGGPESLEVVLGLAKEALFGTRASLGLSLFQNVVRPYLPGASGRQRMFTSRSSGLRLASTYPISSLDTLGMNYEISRSSTAYDLVLPPSLSGRVSSQLRADSSSRSLGLTESRDTGRARLDAGTAVSGGWLGGDEHLLRSSVEYARLLNDPLSAKQGPAGRGNAWAFRGYLAGVASYRGDLPLHQRLFAGEQLVRGLRPGELAPYAFVRSDAASGTTSYRAQSAGADLVVAVNTEYRVPLARRTEAAAFFDTGSGWLIPGWLGADQPTLLGGTRGVLRASTGIEMRWQVPVLEQPVRVHYAVNPLRLGRSILLPDGSRFHPPSRRAALGWALGPLF